MIFKLYGAAGLRTRIEPGSFLVPIFTTPCSNYLFAQQLDTNHRISTFSIIEIGQFPFKFQASQELSAQIGDIGIICYTDEDANIVISDARSAKYYLKSIKCLEKISPFRQLDICSFTGDQTKIHRAIKAAAQNIGNSDIRTRWQKVETTATKLLSQREGSHSKTGDQYYSFDGPDGPERWLTTWKALGASDWLVHLGIQLVFFSDFTSYSRAMIATRIVQSTAIAAISKDVKISILEHTSAFMSDYSFNRDSVIWSYLWKTIRKLNLFTEKERCRWALEFLETAHTRPHHTGSRVSVWKYLWDSKIIDPEILISILEIDLAQRIDSSFARKLVIMLAEMEYDPRINEVLRDWLTTNDLSLPHWSAIYLALLQSGENIDDQFIDIGIEWLIKDSGRLKRWADIFEGICKFRGVDVMIPIAAQWLTRANKEMRVWPKIASIVYRYRDDEELYLEIQKWIHTHPATDEGSELMLLLENERVTQHR